VSTSPIRLPAPELPAGPRSALVIATTTYEDPLLRQLRAPATDAVELAGVLADPRIGGFEVTSVIDRPANEVRIAIEEFLAGRAPEDLVVVYFSCHGVTNARRRLHFAATDTFKARLASTGIDSVWVQDRLEECRARRQVLILDCCFSGAFARGAKGAEALGLDQLTEPGRGRAVLTASDATEYSFETATSGQPTQDSPAPGSIFTAALLTGLRDGSADRDGDGFVTVDEAYAYAYQQVRASGAAQTPQRWLSGGEGQLLLARSPVGRPVIPAALPESLRAALDSPWPNVRIGAIDELNDWLISDDPARVLTATDELEAVADHDIPRVAAAANSALGHLRSAGSTSGQPDQSSPADADHDHTSAGSRKPADSTAASITATETSELAAIQTDPAPSRPVSRAADHEGVGVDNVTTQDRNLAPPTPPPAVPPKWPGRRRWITLLIVVVLVLGAVTGTVLWLSALQGGTPGSQDHPSSTPPTVADKTSATAAQCGAIKDEFDTASLAPGWEQLNGGTFALGGGAMAITASDGADIRGDVQGDVTAPFLARTAEGDFSVETSVTVDPQHSYQGAGLLLYRDSENYVRLERGFGNRGAIAFEYAADGRHTKIHGPFAKGPDPVPTSATVVWLRLVRTGTSIKGFWHAADTTAWQELSGTAPLDGDAKVGLAVLNRSQPPAGDPARKPLTAKFAYVNVTC
jgi:regulation of enolase protein 1 (concanavalin A-like superfamily)